MKNSVILFVLIIIINSSLNAQSPTCDCKADLDFLIEKLQKMPSYKKQIKGEKLKDFNRTYTRLSKEMISSISIEDCFKLLQEQMMLINDLHAKLYFNHEYLALDDYKNEEKRNAFIESEHFINHPRYSNDIEVLIEDLQKRPLESIEGIYNYGTQITVGIYKTSETELEGVILTSDAMIWEPGQIKFTAKKNKFGKYDLLSYDDKTKKLRMLKGVRFDNGRLRSFKKTGNSYNFELSDKHNSDWVFKQLRDDVQYVYFGDFSSFSNDNRKAFKSFYDEHKKSFTAEHIIIDLRNNGGGNSKLSDPFIKLFKKSKAKIYIITNTFTVSNSEQFTAKLKYINNALHVGQTTYGVIAYGLNYGTTYTTPSGYFDVLPTDMNFHKYYSYEGIGIEPDIALAFDRDWIKQIYEIIDSKQSH